MTESYQVAVPSGGFAHIMADMPWFETNDNMQVPSH